MGLKKGKYVYIKLGEDRYVKVRVFKGRAENVPDKYVVVGPIVKRPPLTARVIDILELPKDVADKILNDIYLS
ncbi:MAG TPA: hypothetical protein ENF75_03630 [Acidilobales archaeon]|nr:MAG: hypothetical protein DRO18_07010 [Thermoprotei archaeon]HDD26160.1 hypothetical protein [Acidilobales archaeon]